MTDTAPRRFYKSAHAREMQGGFGVALDERALKTPAGNAFLLPAMALAQACADEWTQQGEHIIPSAMPLTQLAFAAIDWTARAREQRADYVAAYGETDLCCHRAEAPAALVARQAEIWNPLVAWGSEQIGITLPVVTGVVAASRLSATLAQIRARVLALDDFRLTALSQVVGLTGSALIGFALLEGRIDAQAAFTAAALDDLWSLERWGEDAEARARLHRLKSELEATARFIEALSD